MQYMFLEPQVRVQLTSKEGVPAGFAWIPRSIAGPACNFAEQDPTGGQFCNARPGLTAEDPVWSGSTVSSRLKCTLTSGESPCRIETPQVPEVNRQHEFSIED